MLSGDRSQASAAAASPSSASACIFQHKPKNPLDLGATKVGTWRGCPFRMQKENPKAGVVCFLKLAIAAKARSRAVARPCPKAEMAAECRQQASFAVHGDLTRMGPHKRSNQSTTCCKRLQEDRQAQRMPGNALFKSTTTLLSSVSWESRDCAAVVGAGVHLYSQWEAFSIRFEERGAAARGAKRCSGAGAQRPY